MKLFKIFSKFMVTKCSEYIILNGGKLIAPLLCVLILCGSCGTKKLPQQDEFGKGYEKNVSFDKRYIRFKADVAKLVNRQLDIAVDDGNLVYFVYAGFDVERFDCSRIKWLSVDQILSNTTFTPASSYTFVLDDNGDYRMAVWHNGVIADPRKMNTYNKDINLINIYKENHYSLIYQYSNCQIGNYVFGVNNLYEGIDVYRISNDGLKKVSFLELP